MNAVATFLERFKRQDEATVSARVRAKQLWAERDELSTGWLDLLAVSDHAEIARRSVRLGEIGIELARLGY